jgi:hypothetical protein
VKSILNVLSRTRGCQSYLFSTLLRKSQNLLQANHIPASLPTPTEQVDNLECSHSDVPAEEQQQQHTDAEAAEWTYLPEADLI